MARRRRRTRAEDADVETPHRSRKRAKKSKGRAEPEGTGEPSSKVKRSTGTSKRLSVWTRRRQDRAAHRPPRRRHHGVSASSVNPWHHAYTTDGNKIDQTRGLREQLDWPSIELVGIICYDELFGDNGVEYVIPRCNNADEALNTV